MHEENFLGSWLREDVEGKEEGRKDREETVREEESRSGKRDVEREGGETVVKRRCETPFSRGNFEEFSPVEVLGDFGFLCGGSGGSSVCGSAGTPGMLSVLGLLVSPWLVGDLGVDSASVSGCEFCCTLVLFFNPKASSVADGKSRRYGSGGLARRRAAIVEKEDSRSGLRSRQQVSCGLPIGRKKDAESPGPQ